MNLSTNAYKERAQSSTLSSGSVLPRCFATALLSVASAAHASEHGVVLPAPHAFAIPGSCYSNASVLDAEKFMHKSWTQEPQSAPSDDDFSQLAISLAERQHSAPRAIDDIIARHMAELYD